MYFAKTFSKYQRKRKHSHSPPLRSPEPTAKKIRATGNTPPDTCGAAAATTNGLSNGNSHSQNGSSLGSQEENTSMDSSPAQRTPSRRRNTNRDSTPEPPPVTRTRSSTRLRSNKKWILELVMYTNENMSHRNISLYTFKYTDEVANEIVTSLVMNMIA